MKPGNIVGAIANEAGLDSKHIGRVDIRDDHSLVDLPAGMPDNILQHLKKVWVVGQQLRIVEDGQPFEPPRKPGKLALGAEKPGSAKPRFDKPQASPNPSRANPGPARARVMPFHPGSHSQSRGRQGQIQDLIQEPLQRNPMNQRLALAGCTALLLVLTGCDQLGNKAPDARRNQRRLRRLREGRRPQECRGADAG